MFELSFDKVVPILNLSHFSLKRKFPSSRFHEIAHAYLKHPAYTNISVQKAKEFEKQAIELAEKWLGCASENLYQPPNLSFL